MTDSTSLIELIGTIRSATGSELDQAQSALYDRFYRRLLAFADDRIYAGVRRQDSASDVVVVGLNSFLSSIRSGKFSVEDPTDGWETLAFGFVRNKLRKALSRATAARRDADMTEALAQGTHAAEATAECIEDVLDWLTASLPEGDKSRQVFRLSVVEGLTNEQVGEAIGRTARTVQSKKKTALAHIVDMALENELLSDTDRRVVELVLDPRRQVALPEAEENSKVSALDRRFVVAAPRLGLSPTEVKRKVLNVLNVLLGDTPDEGFREGR